jgi:NAD(P)-dependent dehydrogenase (short-subunit alcohol dehydrogenase family)
MIDLKNRVVLVTGAAGGIGSATARTLVGANGRVLVHDLNAEATARLAGELGDAAHGLAADLRHPSATATLWDEALAVHGRIDVLVNNAGIYPPAPLDRALADWAGAWELSLAVNLVAPAILCRAAVQAYARQPEGGIIVNMASRAAFRR